MGKTKETIVPILALVAMFGLGFAAADFLRRPADRGIALRPVASAASKALPSAVVTRVIDGDTVVVQGGDHVRLLGIDADEKGYPCYDAAKARLEQLVLSKGVVLEPDAQDKDQYGRLLRYLFLAGKDIDEQLVAEGLAVARFYPENQKYKTKITAAETEAIKNKTGCKWK